MPYVERDLKDYVALNYKVKRFILYTFMNLICNFFNLTGIPDRKDLTIRYCIINLPKYNKYAHF